LPFAPLTAVSTWAQGAPSGASLKPCADFTAVAVWENRSAIPRSSALRVSRSAFRADADGAALGGADHAAMDDTLICQKGAWRRENARHHYTGSISGSRDGLRLAGRDQVTGIQVTLSIPADEIGDVRVSASWEQQLVGERCVVLDLLESTPILLRAIGGHADPVALARRIANLVHPASAVTLAVEAGA
jgi:hypothetical protein